MDKRERATLPLLFAAGFCAYSCNHGCMIYVPLALVNSGSSLFEAGLQATVFLALAVALRFWLGPLSDKRGTKLFMVLGMGVYAITTPLLGVCQGFGAMLAVRCAQAIGMASFFPCALAAVSEVCNRQRQGMALGLYRLVSSAALMISASVLFPVVQRAGWGGAFALLGIVSACGLLCVVAACVPEPRYVHGNADVCGKKEGHLATRIPSAPERAHGSRPRRRFVATPVDHRRANGSAPLSSLRLTMLAHRCFAAAVLGTTFAVALGYGCITNFAAAFVETIEPSANAGLFMGLVGAGGLVANPAAGWLADRRPTLAVLAAFGVCLGVSMMSLALAARFPIALLVVGFTLGMGYFGAITGALALIAKHVEPAGRSSFISMQQNCIDAGAGFSGLFFGGLLTVAAPAVVFALWGVATAAVSVGTALLCEGRRAH